MTATTPLTGSSRGTSGRQSLVQLAQPRPLQSQQRQRVQRAGRQRVVSGQGRSSDCADQVEQ